MRKANAASNMPTHMRCNGLKEKKHIYYIYIYIFVCWEEKEEEESQNTKYFYHKQLLECQINCGSVGWCSGRADWQRNQCLCNYADQTTSRLTANSNTSCLGIQIRQELKCVNGSMLVNKLTFIVINTEFMRDTFDRLVRIITFSDFSYFQTYKKQHGIMTILLQCKQQDQLVQ